MLLLSIALSSPLAALGPQEPESAAAPEALETFLSLAEEIRAKTATPGASFALVLGGEIAYVGGMGLRDVEAELPATEDTLFAIGSCTKAMTAIIAGKLVHEGKLLWDDPASEHLAGLRFHDPYLTKHATLRDLMAHRTGLGAYNMLWYGAPMTRADLLHSLPHLDSYFSFRKQYAYNNLLYSVAGLVLESAAKRSWESLIQSDVLGPLGMTSSVTSYADFMEHPQRSTGYAFDGVTPLPHLNINVVGPAGGVGSTARDMSKWLRAIVNGGEIPGGELLEREAFEDLTSPQIIIDGNGQAFYGVGWEVEWKRGLKTIGHGGGIVGQNCYVRAVPSKGYGIVILANQQSDFDDLLVRYAEDHFVQGDLERDEAWEARLVARREAKAEARRVARLVPPELEIHGLKPCSLAPSAYAGVYTHPAFSPITVTESEEGCLRFRYNDFEGPVKHWEHEHFLGLADPADAGFQFDLKFELGEDGQVVGLAAGLERGLPDIIMKRQP